MTSAAKKPAAGLGKFDRITTRAGGRIIDTWTYRSGLPGQKALEVRVSLLNPREGVYVFQAMCDVFEAPLQGADLTALRAQADEQLRAWCADRSGLVWQDWLEVQVVGRTTDDDGKRTMGLSIRYRTIPRAVTPEGAALTVSPNGVVTPFPKPHQASAKIDANELIFDDRNSGTEISYIPATPEALAGLQSIQARIDQLRVALSQLLGQDAIAAQLQRLADAPLALPAVAPPAAE